jgi:hypothetical protein
VCGNWNIVANLLFDSNTYSAGAAGNFLATIPKLSVNAFKSVVDIDLIGSYITVKMTLPYLLTSAEKYRTDGRSGKCVPNMRVG